MQLTFKIQNEARALFGADLLTRASKSARTLGLHDRETTQARSPEGRAAAREAKRQGIAVAVGLAYHHNVAPLYVSDYGRVAYGAGGQDEISWKIYAKSYKHPAAWKNAGARWDGREVVLENYRGREVYRAKFQKGAQFGHPACTHGDLYCVADALDETVRHRFNDKHEHTGYAVRFGAEWDHGATTADCVAEHNRKVDLIAARARARTETQKEQRRLRLLARISDRVIVTRDDARAVGACAAGIAGFCKRVGIADDVVGVPARELFRMAQATGERQAIAAGIMAARRAIQQ